MLNTDPEIRVMRVLLDTNVILDFLLHPEAFLLNRRKLVWQAIQQGRVEGYVSPITPVNVFSSPAR